MALSHLVDTSVLTRLRFEEVKLALAVFGAGQIGRAALTDLEIGFSASNAGEWDALRSMIEVFPAVDVMTIDFDTAGRTQRSLAAAGLKGRKVADLLIAAAAERRKLTLVHYDRDFDHIATVTGQPTEWIVPAGSV